MANSFFQLLKWKRVIALALDFATDVLVFDPSERPIADDLQRQFEAISKFPEA